jgi:hypothetical protein
VRLLARVPACQPASLPLASLPLASQPACFGKRDHAGGHQRRSFQKAPRLSIKFNRLIISSWTELQTCTLGCLPCILAMGHPRRRYWTWHVAAGRVLGQAASEGKARPCGVKQRDGCPHMPRLDGATRRGTGQTGSFFAKAGRRRAVCQSERSLAHQREKAVFEPTSSRG